MVHGLNFGHKKEKSNPVFEGNTNDKKLAYLTVRSENWARQYLGQQFYLRVFTSTNSWRDENPIPRNALLCGRAQGRRTRPLRV